MTSVQEVKHLLNTLSTHSSVPFCKTKQSGLLFLPYCWLQQTRGSKQNSWQYCCRLYTRMIFNRPTSTATHFLQPVGGWNVEL